MKSPFFLHTRRHTAWSLSGSALVYNRNTYPSTPQQKSFLPQMPAEEISKMGSIPVSSFFLPRLKWHQNL